ncbi:MAG: class I SAM-dependent methyltransferase [Planctomycetota bacterium]|jgi:SAM-dependent methyltransferase
MLTEKEIAEIHRSVICDRDKYVPLPMQYNIKRWGWRGKSFPRIISLLEFREYMLEYDRVFDNVLSFNAGKDPEYEYLNYRNKHNYNYDGVNNDLHCFDIEKKDFDFAMLNETLEHLYDPIRAVKNVYKHLTTGGMIFASVPADNRPHGEPLHFYTGITATGLGAIMKLAGFDILKLGQWGNSKYFYAESERRLRGKPWPDFTYSTEPGLNERTHPVQAWCLAIKNK